MALHLARSIQAARFSLSKKVEIMAAADAYLGSGTK
jgi:hypothetical protein